MCNIDYLVGKKHMHSSCIFVRPTGNPLDMDGWDKMMTNNDVTVESNNLLSINKLHVNGNMAYVCYTSHGRFRYKYFFFSEAVWDVIKFIFEFS